MKLYSWNVNGYHACSRHGGLDVLLRTCPDIICLQEVKASQPEALDDIFTWDYEKYHSLSEKKGHHGVSVLTRAAPERVEYGIGLDRFDRDGRFLCLEYRSFVLINVYMPHGSRDKHELPYKLDAYAGLRAYLKELLRGEKPVLLAGDFNVAHTELDLERVRDNQGNIMFTEEERNAFGSLLSVGLTDVFRVHRPTAKEYSWWPYAFRARERNVGWRLDYLMISKNGFQVREVRLCKEIPGSDHCPVYAEMSPWE